MNETIHSNPSTDIGKQRLFFHVKNELKDPIFSKTTSSNQG
jgi:hypothetical protein